MAGTVHWGTISIRIFKHSALHIPQVKKLLSPLLCAFIHTYLLSFPLAAWKQVICIRCDYIYVYIYRFAQIQSELPYWAIIWLTKSELTSKQDTIRPKNRSSRYCWDNCVRKSKEFQSASLFMIYNFSWYITLNLPTWDGKTVICGWLWY